MLEAPTFCPEKSDVAPNHKLHGVAFKAVPGLGTRRLVPSWSEIGESPMSHFVRALSFLIALIAAPVAFSADVDWKAVDTAFGREGAAQPDGVHRYSFPR